MNRTAVTEQIIESKIRKGIKWSDVAAELGTSKEWATTACLGQMTLSAEQAEKIAALFDLPGDAVTILQTPPLRGQNEAAIAADPLVYRLREIVAVYGPTIKELIHEEFGDGIMSAIDFRMALNRREDPAGDRVELVLSGKYLPYPGS
ncbi:cyanate lyase [Streptomyces umbrinus]|uniref:cyanase n=1 Tax=Streptomyces umbrinus TaxID=67370 RepID=UPI00167DFE9C|nr:cyanase [Streptomyces umbrinus]MCR3731944.1 cyanate lyase [Streptomyces umbrinus]GHH66534.1 cyanate hydratase [Streptomyces umbrinus]